MPVSLTINQQGKSATWYSQMSRLFNFAATCIMPDQISWQLGRGGMAGVPHSGAQFKRCLGGRQWGDGLCQAPHGTARLPPHWSLDAGVAIVKLGGMRRGAAWCCWGQTWKGSSPPRTQWGRRCQDGAPWMSRHLGGGARDEVHGKGVVQWLSVAHQQLLWQYSCMEWAQEG